jgi:hypothetical protein
MALSNETVSVETVCKELADLEETYKTRGKYLRALLKVLETEAPSKTTKEVEHDE